MTTFVKFLFMVSFLFGANRVVSQFTIQWQKSLGGTLDDAAYSISQSSNGGYVLAGYSKSNDGDVSGHYANTSQDYWVVKVDSIGNIQWQKSLGGGYVDIAYSISQTSDGGCIVAGHSNSIDGDFTGHHTGGSGSNYDYGVVKLDGSGSIQWQKSLGGDDNDYAKSIEQTSDGGYIVTGYSTSNNGDVTGVYGMYDYWIVKLDNIGGIEWQKAVGGTYTDIAYSISQTSDGGYIVAGGSESNDGDATTNQGYVDLWVLKLDGVGNTQWQKSWGGSDQDQANSIQQTSDGGYIVAGFTKSFDVDVTGSHGNIDYWVLKLDGNGNVQWKNCLGGSSDDVASSIKQTLDGGYIVAGYSASDNGNVTVNHGSNDFWIVKLDGNGNIQHEKSLGGTNSDVATSILQTSDGGYVVAGYSNSNDGDITGNHGANDYWIVKLNPLTVGIETMSLEDVDIYPNPSDDVLRIMCRNTPFLGKDVKVRVFDLQGKEVLMQGIEAQVTAVDVSTLFKGIYIVKVGTLVRKIVIE